MTRDFEPPKPLRGEGEGESADLFDYQLLKYWVGFILRGVRRHRVLSAITFVVVAVSGVVATLYYPKTYHVESKLLANRSQVIRSLSNPRSRVSGDDPTRAAEEIIFARDNLVALIRQTNLIQRWGETRAPVLRLKDSLMGLIAGKLSEEDKLDSMVGTLEKKLHVRVDSQTVTITVDWPDAQLAYQIVEAAQQNFLETRHVTEMAAISEALSILEMHAAKVQDSVEDSLQELEKTRELRRKGQRAAVAPVAESETSSPVAAPPSPTPAPAARPATQLATEQELAQIRFLINSKRRAAADLEDFRARRLSELNAQLAEQRVQYADQHPVIVDTLNRITALKQDSPQLVQLRQDAADLTAEYRRKSGGEDPDVPTEPRRAPTRGRSTIQVQAALSNSELADDPVVEHARTNLRMATAKYEELMMSIDSARIELDTARAAFKYRYSVVRPASVPKKAVKPNVPMLLIATFIAALGLGMLSGTVRDLWRGRLVEAWQVERTLGLKVLSEVRLP